jgi:hypothetical protein
MRLRLIPIFFVLVVCRQLVQCQAGAREAGSTSLVLTYTCQPAQRLALHEHMASVGRERLEQFKARGVLSSYRILFSRYVDNENWDMMLTLRFKDGAALAKWREVESQSPAGLTAPALAMVTSVSTTPVDLVRSNPPPDVGRGHVFLVIPYEYKVSTSEYVQYLDGYVLPQLDGWVAEKNLGHYEVYLARYGASRPWSALLLLEYTDDQALDDRSRIVAKVRDRLKENPSWKSLAEGKQNVRMEKQAVVSDELAPLGK